MSLLAINPQVGSALVNGVGSLFSGILGNSAQSTYNKNQLQIARETNALNYQMFNEQNQWNLDQWLREQAYNTPYQQMQRYLDAGINPYMAMGNISAGNASSITSADAKPAVIPNQVPKTAFADMSRNIANDALSLFSASAQVEKLKSETNINNIDSLTRLAENIARLKGQGLDNVAKELENTFTEQTFQARKSASDAAVAEITNHAKLLFEQARSQQIQNFIDEHLGFQLSAQQLQLLKAQTDKTLWDVGKEVSLLPFQKAEMVANRVMAYANAHHLNIDASQIDRLTPFLVQYYEALASGQHYDAGIKYNEFQAVQNDPNWFLSPASMQQRQALYNFMGQMASLATLFGVGKFLRLGRVTKVGGFR